MIIRGHLGLGCCIAASLFAAPLVHAGDQHPAETTIIYEWGNGTVAPQYHEDHRITIRSRGASEVSVIKGVGGKELKAAFDPNGVKLKELLDYIHSNALDTPPPPGSIQSQRLRPGDGTCNLHFVVGKTAYAMSCQYKAVGSLLNMMQAMVPDALLSGG